MVGLVLDSKPDFNEHVNNKINKCNKSIDIMKKISLTLPINSLLTISKTFVEPILDYRYNIWQTFHWVFYDEGPYHTETSPLICRASDTSRDRIYREIGVKSHPERRWSRKNFFFHKIINGQRSLSYRNQSIDLQSKWYITWPYLQRDRCKIPSWTKMVP